MKRRTLWAMLCLGPLLLGAGKPIPRKRQPSNSKPAKGSDDTRTIFLSDEQVATVFVHPGGSILTFPAKPTKVIIGREHQFDVSYIENDVAIVALVPSASANMFVYLLGRRYAFNLKTVPDRGDRIIVIRDARDNRVEVKVE